MKSFYGPISGRGNEIVTLVLYVVAGGMATAVHYLVTIVSVEGFRMDALLASMGGFTLGAATKYVLNYFVAFRSGQRHVRAAPRFVAMLALMFAANAVLFWLLNEVAGVFYIVAQAVTTLALVPFGYAINRSWVFA